MLQGRLGHSIKTKDDVVLVFKMFHNMVERETSKSLKHLYSDKGGEYIAPVKVYCKSICVRREQFVLKTPQYNGVAQRMTDTIINIISCMLSHSMLQKHFWDEAVNIIVYFNYKSISFKAATWRSSKVGMER